MNASFKVSWQNAAALLLALICVGCGGGGDVTGPTGQVDGVVTLDGKPLAEGTISFYDGSTGQSAGGTIENGKFVVAEPVNVGDYTVSILPPPAPQPDDEASGEQARALAALIPEGYADESQSGLTATVVEGPNSFTFPLSGDGPSQTGGANVAPSRLRLLEIA